MRREFLVGAGLAGVFALPVLPALVLQGCGDGECVIDGDYPLEEGRYSICAGGTHRFAIADPVHDVTFIAPNIDRITFGGQPVVRFDGEVARLECVNLGQVTLEAAAGVDYELLLSIGSCVDE